MNENTKKAAKSGITFGTCLAMVISYTSWNSVGTQKTVYLLRFFYGRQNYETLL